MSQRAHSGPAWIALCMVCLAFNSAAHASSTGIEATLESQAMDIAGQVDGRVVEVLPRIDGLGGKLLALRSYLRSGERLTERWSWSQEQIAAYEGSPEQRELQAEIERVREAFALTSPGFELFVNPQVRSLDVQLANWNRNESVAAAAARLLVDAQAHFARAGQGKAVQEGAQALVAFLKSYAPEPVPTVAAPGLSPHGQMRAIDFQVHQDGQIIAGPDSRTIDATWEQGGWAQKLDVAVRQASSKFVGPLVSPREPWHYTYTPVAVASQ
jgi:hypothetical protein